MQRTRTRARFRRIPELARRTPGGRSGGTGGGGGSSGSSGDVGMVGLSNFSAANFMMTAAGGGEAGVASGFLVAALVRLLAIPGSLPHVITARTGPGIASGNYLRFDGNGKFTSLFAIDGVTKGPSGPQLLTSDIGRIHLVLAYLDAASAGLWVDRVKATPIPVNPATYLPASAGSKQTVGTWEHDLSQCATAVSILDVAAYRGLPSDAQVLAFFDAARSLGGLPDSLGSAGAHRWSARDELRGTVVVDGQTAPAQLTDTVTRAPVDALVRQGSPVVRVIDQSADGRRLLGAMGFSASNYLQAPPGKGIIGAPNALTVQALVIPPATGGSGYAVATLTTGLTGYQLQVTPTSITFSIADAAGAASTIVYTVDNQRSFLATGTWDGTNIRIYKDDVLGGTQAVAGFTPGTTAMRIGDRPHPTGSPFAGGVCGAQGGDFVASLADIQASYSAWVKTGKPGALPGAQHYYDLTTDILASGVDAVPAVVQDRVGTDHLTRVGGVSWAGGLTLAQRTERLWSYETSPIWYAVNAFTDADSYTSTDGVTGNAAGCWFGVPFVVESQVVASQTRTLIGKGAAGRGWSLSSAGTNSSLGSVLFSGVGAPTNGPVIVVAAADVGKLMLLIVSWDGAGKIHAYVKRTESGTGATMTGFTPAAPGDPFTLGRHPFNAAQNASGIRILGCMGGTGVPSLAEVQAAHDAFLAIEDLVEIPGKTDYLISIKQDAIAAGGALPTTLVNRKGAGGLSKVGAPQLAPIYARAAAW
jgi:hypothetical protein